MLNWYVWILFIVEYVVVILFYVGVIWKIWVIEFVFVGFKKGRKNVLFNMDLWIVVFFIIIYGVVNGEYNIFYSVEF